MLKLVEENGEFCLELKVFRECVFLILLVKDYGKLGYEVDVSDWLFREFSVLEERFGMLQSDLLLSFVVKSFDGRYFVKCGEIGIFLFIYIFVSLVFWFYLLVFIIVYFYCLYFILMF